MIRFLGFLFLSYLHFSLSFASRIHGRSLDHPIEKRPANIRQAEENGQVVRMSMTRRPPRIATKVSRADKHRPSHTTSSEEPSFTPIAVNTTTYFEDSAYGIKLWIGSNNPQSVILDFDTGSSETWVSPPCTELSDFPEFEELCRELGTYVPDQSFSVVDLNETCPAHWLMYGSGSVFVRYYKDVIQFSDPLFDWGFEPGSPVLTKGAQFGLALSAQNMPSGLFGAGYGGGYNQDYNSMIDEMYEQGLIQDKDFSIALGSVGSDDGEIIFGGVDLAKFTGPLHELEISHQIPKADDGYYRYWINVTSIGFTTPGSCETVPITPISFNERFLPDSGTSLTYMPYYAFNSLLEVFPDVKENEDFGYVVDCSIRDQPGTIDFTFDDFTINVPYSEFIFVIPAGPSSGPEDVCLLGAYPSEDIFILGDTFLRSVYAIFRQQQHKIYFAKFKDCGSNVVSSHDSLVYRLHGDCEHDDKDSNDGRRYGSPNDNSTQSSCSSITTGAFPPEPSSTSDPFDVSTWVAHPKMPRPAIQTGDVNKMRSPGPPWSGNETAATGATGSGNTIGSTGHRSAPSIGFPTPSLTKNVTFYSSSLPSITFSSSQLISSSWLTGVPAPSSSAGDWSSSSSWTDKGFTEESSTTKWFTHLPPSSISSAPETPSTSTFWPTESSSSSSYSYSSELSTSNTHRHHTTTSPSSSEVSLITIPVQPDETVIVKLESTTYTLVDGTTVESTPKPGRTTESFICSGDCSSWLSSLTHITTSDESSTWSEPPEISSWTSEWNPSTTESEIFTRTTEREPSTTRSPSRTRSTKSTRRTTTQSPSSTEADGYLTSWFWNPTGSGTEDPFYPPASAYTESSDTEGYHHHHTDTETYSYSYTDTETEFTWTSIPITQSSSPDAIIPSTSEFLTPESTPDFTTIHIKHSSKTSTHVISHNENIKAQQSSTRKYLAVARPATTDVADKIHRLVPPRPGGGDEEPGQEDGSYPDDM